jgi:hypothetical protein
VEIVSEHVSAYQPRRPTCYTFLCLRLIDEDSIVGRLRCFWRPYASEPYAIKRKILDAWSSPVLDAPTRFMQGSCDILRCNKSLAAASVSCILAEGVATMPELWGACSLVISEDIPGTWRLVVVRI